MSKKTVQNIVSVMLGLAAFVILSTLISMLFDVFFTKDTITITSPGESLEEVIAYVKNSSIAIICISVPMLASYCMTYFIKNKKLFGIISLCLSFLAVAMCIGFIFDLNKIVLGLTESRMNGYTVATTYFSELIALLTSCLLTGVYFTVVTVSAFGTKSSEKSETYAANAQILSGEEGEEIHEKG